MRLTNITAHDAAGTPTGTQLSEQCLRQVLFDVLQQNVLCSIATVTPDGRPHINTAYFCYSDELELYFLSHPHSVHSQNLSTNSAAAMAIFSSAQQWATRDVGVQLFGTGIVAEGAEAKKAEELYGNRFSGYADWKASRSGNIDAEYRFYRFVVLRVKVLDEANIGDGVIVSATIHRD